MISILLVYRDYRDKTTRASRTNIATNKIAAALPRIRLIQITAKYTKVDAAIVHRIEVVHSPLVHKLVPHKATVAAITTTSGRLIPNIISSGTIIIPTKTSAIYDDQAALFTHIEACSADEQKTGVSIILSNASAKSQIMTPLAAASAKIRRKLPLDNG